MNRRPRRIDTKDEELMAALNGRFGSKDDCSITGCTVIISKDGKEESLEAPDISKAEAIAENLIRKAFEESEEDKVRIRILSNIIRTEPVYEGDKLTEHRQWMSESKAIRENLLLIDQRRVENWPLALEWARENGADLRRGETSRELAIVRIHEAGLMDAFNLEWRDFEFSEDEVETARKVLRNREEFYAKKRKTKEASG